MSVGEARRRSIQPAQQTILITGFGPFPGISDNATARLVPRLAAAASARWPSLRILCEVLPTEWLVAPPRVAEMLVRHRPVLALHFGVAKEAQGFEIELQGRNRCRLAPDNAGVVPAAERLLENGADAHCSNLPVDRILARLNGLGLPARASNDAGGYLCNALLYHSMRHVDGASQATLAGFVHVPACLSGTEFDGTDPPPSCPLTWDQAVRGGLEIIDVALLAAGSGAKHAG